MSDGITVVVGGGRHFNKREHAFAVLDTIHAANPIALLVHGACEGADLIARDWALLRAVQEVGCPADWDRHGRAAGPIRNRQMLETYHPDMVIVFPGGKGTENLTQIARQMRLRVLYAGVG